MRKIQNVVLDDFFKEQEQQLFRGSVLAYVVFMLFNIRSKPAAVAYECQAAAGHVKAERQQRLAAAVLSWHAHYSLYGISVSFSFAVSDGFQAPQHFPVISVISDIFSEMFRGYDLQHRNVSFLFT